MNVVEVLSANTDNAAVEFAKSTTVWGVNIRNYICRLKGFVLQYFKDIIETFSAEENEIYKIFKKKLDAETKYYLSKNTFTGAEVAERFKKVSWVIRQNARQLGMAVIEETPLPAPKSKQKEITVSAGKNAVLEYIAEIEVILDKIKKTL